MTLSEISLQNNINSRVAMRVIEGAIEMAENDATTIGAYQQRLDYNLQNVLTTEENDQAAESRVRDSDMAQAMMGFTKQKMLVESSQAMLAQANQNSSNVIGLLQ